MVIQQSNEAITNRSSTQMWVNPKQDHKVGTIIYSVDTEKSFYKTQNASW